MARRFKRKRMVRRRKRKSSFGTKSAPFATKYAAKLKYHDEITLSPGVTASTHVFTANGIFDPNITGTGHQPRGFDQIMPMYDHYVVVGSTISATFINTTNSPLYVGIAVRDSDTVSSQVNDYLEGQSVRFTTIPPALGGNALQRTITMKLNPNKFLSRSHPLSDPDLKGNNAANPTEQCYFHIFTESTDSSDPADVSVAVAMTYSALFIEPRPLASS